jgi:nucleoside-diphosphate-sugar epimerase
MTPDVQTPTSQRSSRKDEALPVQQEARVAARADVVPFAAADLRVLDGSRIIVTGGSGFVGTAFACAVIAARDVLGIQVQLDVVCRRPGLLRPEIAGDPDVTVVRADASSPDLAPGRADFAIHAAFAPTTTPDEAARAVRWAVRSAPRVLVTSSGAVYGPRTGPATEDQPLRGGSAYADSKLRAEAVAADNGAVIGRLFSFCGRGLPADGRFALSDFLLDRLAGRPVVVRSTGQAVRSYLDVADLTVALLALLVRGHAGSAYNVGSPDAITVGALAETVAAMDLGPQSPPVPVERRPDEARRGVGADYYVPDLTRLRGLDVIPRISLDEGLRRTASGLRTPEETPWI